MNSYKLVVFVPQDSADILREEMSKAGAGKIGNYSNCSFSSKGFGRFKPLEGSNPTVGEIGSIEKVEEERIEVVCDENCIKDVLQAMKSVHPYEEVAYDVYQLVEIK